MSSFRPGPDSASGLDVTSVSYGDSGTSGTSETIFIGDSFNQTVTVFKAFIGSISYEMGKEIKEQQNHTQNYYSFASYNGTFAIKISLNVPAASITEAKNNLAKISLLQTMILAPRSADKTWQVIYLSNLINSGLFKKTNFQPDNWRVLSKVGLWSWMTEIDYSPDFSQGFYEGSDGLYPKFYKIDMTINPDTTIKVDGTNRKFLDPFNSNGHYSLEDSTFFPFLLKVGEKNHESSDIDTYYNSDYSDMLSMNKISEDTRKASSLTSVYVSLPIDKSLYDPTTTDTGIIARTQATDDTKKIRRQLMFKGFLESSSRKFKTDIKTTVDQGTVLKQSISSYGSKMPIEYSFSFQVPSQNYSEAVKNAAKIQYLMRMFYTRNDTGSQAEAKVLYSLRVYVPSFIGKSNSQPTSLDDAYEKSYILQTKNISIEIDLTMGFFKKDNRYFPKSYKVSFDMIDSEYSNQRKFAYDGNLEVGDITTEKQVQKKDENGDFMFDADRNPILVTVRETTPDPGFDGDLSNISSKKRNDYVSNIKFWSTE